jgi:protein tyrosine/serine phosphatase
VRTWRIAFVVVALLARGVSAQTNSADQAASRPPAWAVKLDRPGLPNFFQLTTNLYRGAQPTTRGMAELKALGIKIIVNLRTFHSDDVKISGGGLTQDRLKMEPWRANDDDMVRFLKIVADTNNLPVFVHCERGADRTGTMCAMYRIVFCGWTKPEAIREMKEGGFGFNPAWKNLVNYLERADAEKLKSRAGLSGR